MTLKKAIFSLLILCLSLAAAIGFILWGSLPHTAGVYQIHALTESVRIDRDPLGIPLITGANRIDVARATGFLHAQERFFQMDLLRRKSAGELSEIFGRATLELDKQRRLHQFRQHAQTIFANLTPEEQKILEAYAEGVNQGLHALVTSPFEYWLISEKPRRWDPIDSLLVGLGLFFELSDSTGRYDLTRGYMHDLLPEQVNRFMLNNGSIWESPLDGTTIPFIEVPDASHFEYVQRMPEDFKEIVPSAPRLVGSNHWALDGQKTQNGKSLVACDMHLPLTVPNIWYRTGFIYPDEKGAKVSIWGITVPGLPYMVIGSNTNIAWGFTNACVDTTDVVMLTVDPVEENRYLTPDGQKEFSQEIEEIRVKGESPTNLLINKTIWGPVIPEKFKGQPLALKWAAHQPESFNLHILDFEKCASVEEAMQVARTIRLPVLNIVIGDRMGHIGWTLIGFIPKRFGYEGTLPVSFADGTKGWEGSIAPHEYPMIIDSKEGFLWTANNRVLGGEWRKIWGNGGLSNGIRAWDIRNTLAKIERADPQQMLSLQLDDDVFFLRRWQKLLLEKLNQMDLTAAIRQSYRNAVEAWDGTCSTKSVGYRLIRDFRTNVKEILTTRLFWPCFAAWEKFENKTFDYEEPIWMLARGQHPDLMGPQDLENIILSLIQKLPENLDQYTWGEVNRLKMEHPLSKKFTWLSHFLNMPAVELTGDFFVPHVTSPTEGASQRMVVNPGAESEGIFHMPGGQSGNPISPHYRDAQTAWVEGLPTPFLPGKTVETLILIPSKY